MLNSTEFFSLQILFGWDKKTSIPIYQVLYDVKLDVSLPTGERIDQVQMGINQGWAGFSDKAAPDNGMVFFKSPFPPPLLKIIHIPTLKKSKNWKSITTANHLHIFFYNLCKVVLLRRKSVDGGRTDIGTGWLIETHAR